MTHVALAAWFILKWLFGSLFGLAVCMALVYLGAWFYGHEPDPDPVGVMLFMCIGAIVTLVCL